MKARVVFKVVIWVIAALLVISAVNVLSIHPTGKGPVAQTIGIYGAIVFYALLYLIQAGMLAYSEIYERKALKMHTLTFVYLTSIFTAILTLLNNGAFLKVVDNAFIIVLSFGSWLYWRFTTNYIDPEDFRRKIDDLPDERTKND